MTGIPLTTGRFGPAQAAMVIAACAGISAPLLRAADPPDAARIVSAAGTVEISQAGAVDWLPAQTNLTLRTGYRLRTGERSRAVLLWADRSVATISETTTIEILPPPDPASHSGLQLWRGLISFFHRDEPTRLRVIARSAMAGIDGTEFVVAVDPATETATFSVIDGQLTVTNLQGRLTLTNLQQAVVEAGQAPRPTPGFAVSHLLQWCFYYPAVLDLDELPLDDDARHALGDSLAAYRAGDLLAALQQHPADRPPASAAERLYQAALLLSVGLAAQAETVLASLPEAQNDGRTARLANALRLLIAVVRRDPLLTPPRDTFASQPETASEALARSYYEQARALGDSSLRRALDAARRATERSPNFSFAWARVAALEFSFGRTGPAAQAVERSRLLAPRNAEALSLQGFLAAAQNHPRTALDYFNQALAIDPALGNAWLGRGLCKIRLSRIELPFAPDPALSPTPSPARMPSDPRTLRLSALDDLLIAAAVEPQRSLLRSYLGKAYTQKGDLELARHELDLAAALDPRDPTPWLYSALLLWEQHRFNEAIDHLEHSSELNQNRALFRSQLLLDQDQAVRSADLAKVYRDNAMPEVGLREAARAVTYDYANYSAHLFLANSFDALRDPTRFNLRYETPWFNELLLANLLAPPGAGVLSPNISQQEYSRLFERGRLGLATTTEWRSDEQYREVASQFGSFERLSYSLDLDWQHNEGVRPNNELTRIEWYSQLKLQLTPLDSVLLLTKYQDYHSGDNFQYYNPSAFTYATNLVLGPGGITNVLTRNPAYRRHFDFDEIQDPTLLAAYHREWAPGIHTLGMGGRLINEQHVSDKTVPLSAFRTNAVGNLVAVQTSDFDIRYRSRFEIWISELNQIVQAGRNTLVLGGRFQTGEFETKNQLTNTTLFNAFFPPVQERFDEDFQRWSLYGYDTWAVVPDHLWLTAGVSYDHLRYPQNYRQPPLSAGDSTAELLGPKAALVWNPTPIVTVRSAYSHSLGGVSFDESYRLEPPQLAGFNQSYRSIISESVVGSVSAPSFETAGTALDLKFTSRTYVGLLGEILTSQVDRTLGIYEGPNTAQPLFPASTPEKLDYHEYSAGLVLNQLLSDEWSLGASYRFTRSELESDLPAVSSSLAPDAHRFDRADLHTFSPRLLYQHPSGVFAQGDLNWYWQDNFERTRNATGQSVSADLPGDDFWQLNFWVGYRLRRNAGDIAIGLLNATDTDYRLNPLNPYLEMPREREVAARVRLRF